MGLEKFCQNCSMPMHTQNRGSEKDGSASEDYCKYCYDGGQFTSPALTLEQMKLKIAGIMQRMKLPDNTLQHAIALLPVLKRWRKNETGRKWYQ